MLTFAPVDGMLLFQLVESSPSALKYLFIIAKLLRLSFDHCQLLRGSYCVSLLFALQLKNVDRNKVWWMRFINQMSNNFIRPIYVGFDFV